MLTLAIASAPAPRTDCSTCGHAAAQPYRRLVGGQVVEGCIDEFHSDAMLHLDSPASEWHWRPVAIRFRGEVAARRAEMFR